MKYVFYLSGDFIDLGKEEVFSLLDAKNPKLMNNLLIIDLDSDASLNKIFSRLALTKQVYRLLFECKADELIETMKKFDWNSVYRDNFCLRINDLNDVKYNNEKYNKNKKSNKKNEFSERKLASYIWNAAKNPKVDLENPKTLVQLFFIGDKAYCGLLVKKLEYEFDSRKSHLRPFPHPSSLHPKIARALINITGIKNDEIMLDPFCGTGGFLIEAGLMKIKSIGYDISKIMIDGCKENLIYFKINNSLVKMQNALKINNKFDYVVTDLPYGLNSNAILKYNKNDWKEERINLKMQKKDSYKNLEGFYLKFLKNLRKKLKKKAVIVFPDFVNYKKLLRNSKFKIEKEFEQYVHRSLRRKIVRIR